MPKRTAHDSVMARPAQADVRTTTLANEAAAKTKGKCPECNGPMRYRSSLGMCEGCWREHLKNRNGF